jgi:hypothetical protein
MSYRKISLGIWASSTAYMLQAGAAEQANCKSTSDEASVMSCKTYDMLCTSSRVSLYVQSPQSN